MQAGQEQGFIGVDIADAGDKALIQQEWFEGPFSLREKGVESVCGEMRFKGFGA